MGNIHSLSIAEKLQTLHNELPSGVQVVAVSKFHPASLIEEAYKAGQRLFGESRVQELLQKISQLPKDIEWHFIGHLQTNKVKQIIGKTALIESVDSENLIEIIDRESKKQNVITRVLMQVHVAEEETKFGFYPEELKSYFRERKFENLSHTHIAGVMAMATNTDNIERIRKDFASVASLFREIKTELCPDIRDFNIISMGMSGDWPIAVVEGSTMIRVGSMIFGEREYN